MTAKIKIGLIGIGHIAKHQINALKQLDSFEIVAVCDVLEEKRNSIPLNVPFYTDYKVMLLNQHHIDAVLISTPNISHFGICKYMLRNEIPVLVEKPATHKDHLLDELIQLSINNNVPFIVAYHASFANDVLWFSENLSKFEEKFGPITGFQCQFYDPYVQDGQLLTNAENLQGSWIDSGINALSVISRFIPPKNLQVNEARLSQIDGFNCNEIQGTVEFTFPIDGQESIGRGQIDTNWTLGVNHKQTKLFFDHTNQTIILNHSAEQVLLLKDNLVQEIIKDFSNSRPRLEKHYSNLFRNFYEQMIRNKDNLELSRRLHEKLFYPYKLKRRL